MPARAVPVDASASGRTQKVTVLETLPAARYKPLTWLPKHRPFAEAPHGRFTYRDAIKAAISRAET